MTNDVDKHASKIHHNEPCYKLSRNTIKWTKDDTPVHLAVAGNESQLAAVSSTAFNSLILFFDGLFASWEISNCMAQVITSKHYKDVVT